MKKLFAGLAALLLLAGCGSGTPAPAPAAADSEWTAPDVVGLPLDAAKAAMSSAGVPDVYIYNPGTQTSGLVVVDQKPKGGTAGASGQRMTVDVVPDDANGPAGDPASSAGLTYTVAGSGTASVSYFDGSGQIAQETEVTLPWSRTIQSSGGFAGAGIYSVQAQHTSGGGSISCAIQAGGVMVTSNESTGEYAIVSCQTH